MNATRDLLVLGAGPSGLAAALFAARAGLDVAVLDPAAAPHDKACGEGLMPATLGALARLGVDPPGSPITGIRYVDGAWRASGDFRVPGRGVRRTALSGALFEAAAARGIPLLRRRAVEVAQDDTGVSVDGTRARWVIAADGLHSPTRRSLGLDRAVRPTGRLGLRRHAAMAPWTDRVEVHWAPGVEAYITPVGPEEVGVAFLFAEDVARGLGGSARFDALLSRFPALKARLDGAAWTSFARGAGPFHHRATRVAAGRVLLLGDAAGYLDPLTGEGLKLGLLGAEAAVGALLAGAPARWETAWRRLWRSYALPTGGLLALAQGPLRRAIVPVAASVPGLMPAIVRAIGH